MGRPWKPPEPHLPRRRGLAFRRRGEAVRPRGFPRQRVAGVPPVVATAADLKELLNPLGGLTSLLLLLPLLFLPFSLASPASVFDIYHQADLLTLINS